MCGSSPAYSISGGSMIKFAHRAGTKAILAVDSCLLETLIRLASRSNSPARLRPSLTSTQHAAWMLVRIPARSEGIVHRVAIRCPAGIGTERPRDPARCEESSIWRRRSIAGGNAIGAVPVVGDLELGRTIVTRHRPRPSPGGAGPVCRRGWVVRRRIGDRDGPWTALGLHPLAAPVRPVHRGLHRRRGGVQGGENASRDHTPRPHRRSILAGITQRQNFLIREGPRVASKLTLDVFARRRWRRRLRRVCIRCGPAQP